MSANREIPGEDELIQSEVKQTDPPKPKGFWGLLILTALYLLSPIDLLPEAFLGPLGFTDDAVLLAYLLKRIFDRFR